MTNFGILPFTSLRVLVAGLAADRQPFWVFKQLRLVCRQLRVAIDTLLVEKDIGGRVLVRAVEHCLRHAIWSYHLPCRRASACPAESPQPRPRLVVAAAARAMIAALAAAAPSGSDPNISVITWAALQTKFVVEVEGWGMDHTLEALRPFCLRWWLEATGCPALRALASLDLRRPVHENLNRLAGTKLEGRFTSCYWDWVPEVEALEGALPGQPLMLCVAKAVLMVGRRAARVKEHPSLRNVMATVWALCARESRGAPSSEPSVWYASLEPCLGVEMCHRLHRIFDFRCSSLDCGWWRKHTSVPDQ